MSISYHYERRKNIIGSRAIDSRSLGKIILSENSVQSPVNNSCCGNISQSRRRHILTPSVLNQNSPIHHQTSGTTIVYAVPELDKRKKREAANSNERRRMRCINNGFEQLKRCLPVVAESHCQSSLDSKLSKANILSQACRYLIQLKEQIRDLSHQLKTQQCRHCGLLQSATPCELIPYQNNSNSNLLPRHPLITVTGQPPLRHYQRPLSTKEDLPDECQSSMDNSTTVVSSAPENLSQPRRMSSSAPTVNSLSFTHLLQAVEVLHDRPYPSLGSPSSSSGTSTSLFSPITSSSKQEECSASTDCHEPSSLKKARLLQVDALIP